MHIAVRGAAAPLLAVLAACGNGAGPKPAVRPAAIRPPPPLAATAAAAAEQTSPGVSLSYLSDDYERMFPTRLKLARRGAVRFGAGDAEPAADGGGADLKAGYAPELVVIDRQGGRLRVVAEAYNVRLLLWIEADDARTVVAEASDLAPALGEVAPAAPAPGVRARPGAVAAVEEAQGSQRRVALADTCVIAYGWLPARRLGRMYVPAAEPEPLALDLALAVPGGTVVVDRPGGRVLARFTESCSAERTGPDEGEHTPIVYRGDGFDVRGWIASDAAQSALAVLFGGLGSAGGLGFFMSKERLVVPAGTCLHARPGGPVIGVALGDLSQTVREEEDGWWQLAVSTEWGALPVWVGEVESAREKKEGRGRGEQAAREREEEDPDRALAEILARGGARMTVEHGPLRRCR